MPNARRSKCRKEIFFLKEKREISKKCIKHSKVEVISYKNFKHTDGTTKKNYKIRETDND